MIPTHEPNALLRQTLASVLAHASATAEMQIAVVDDCSVHSDVKSIVASLPNAGHVELYPSSQRLGLAGNWNRAISLARGELVHILHQDDSVEEGFYERMSLAYHKYPSIGMAFCRSRIIDGQGRHIKKNSRQAWRQGILRNWLPRIAERQRIQTPSAVVPRHIYDRVGGYRSDLLQAVDWEMWVRIAASFEVWYEPRVMATFRRHDESESSRLRASGTVWQDLAHAITINGQSLPASIRVQAMNRSARWYAASALRTARIHVANGRPEMAHAAIDGARRLVDLCTDRPTSLRLEQRIWRLQRRDRQVFLRAA